MRYFACLFLFCSLQISALDFDKIDAGLRSKEGLLIEVHGIDKDHGLFAGVLRGEDFFDFAQVPLVGATPVLQESLLHVKRHDIIKIKGKFDELGTPQKHILVDFLEVQKPYDPGYPNVPAFKHKVKLPDDLVGLKEITAKVHAITEDGKIMMVEYKDTNIPVIVVSPKATKDLYRGDKIKFQFSIAKEPKAPVHLILKSGKDSLKVLKSIVSENKREIKNLCGPLVLYPASPDIRFNVFALHYDIGDDLAWTYTLINFEDSQKFKAIREKLQTEWDKDTSQVERGRGYYINPKLQVCVSGIGNEVMAIQANPQVILQGPDDISFVK